MRWWEMTRKQLEHAVAEQIPERLIKELVAAQPVSQGIKSIPTRGLISLLYAKRKGDRRRHEATNREHR